MTILKLGNKNFSEVLKKAADAVKGGKILVCPTDTVYGLVCDADNREAVKKLFKIKKRDSGKKVPIFVRDIKAAKKLAYISKKQEEFLKKVWPGKLTAVLKSKKGGTIGLRTSDYKLISQLLKESGKSLTGTSANISGKPATGEIKKVVEQFDNQNNQPDLVIDAGNLPKSKTSTVINLIVWPPKILRP